MSVRIWLFIGVVALFLLSGPVGLSFAAPESSLEKALSDTLDTWRDGNYEQLFEQLAHRGKTSREAFVKKMRESNVRPACCWQKMENFKVLDEKRTEATVYVKVGLEGTPNASESVTREFKLTHMEGVWKMQLSDILSMAGISGKKRSGSKRY